MLIIGEKINATLKSVKRAVEERDTKFLQNLAKSQSEMGANYIDVNVSTDKGAEFDKESMEWIVEKVQEVVDIPLSIDSPDPKIIEAGLRKAKRESMINSVTAEPERLESILPLAKEFDSEVIALAIIGSISSEAEGRLKACEKIAESAQKHGIALGKLYFDPLALSVATDTSQGIVTLETLKRIKAEFPQAKTTIGLSNISFGLPERKLINQVFMILTMGCGMDAAIIDSTDKRMMAIVKTATTLLGEDNFCGEYIQAYRKGKFTFEK
ncbi:5-methyltetrahydrofolate:corrinoid/iron-sulfur protein co-methyltransferase [subsurface metagenome]